MNIFYMQLSWSDCMLSHFSHVQLFVTPADCSLPGFSVPGILQARVLEWVAMPSSRGSSWPRDQTWVSHIADRLPSEPSGKECKELHKCPHSAFIYRQWRWPSFSPGNRTRAPLDPLGPVPSAHNVPGLSEFGHRAVHEARAQGRQSCCFGRTHD